MHEISVLVLTYNHEKYIENCLKSIILQNTAYEFPIYIVDDCSSDKTIEILKQFKVRYPSRINLILNEYNHVSRNEAPAKAAMDLIDSTFVAFCDGDDYWTDENKIKKQLILMNSNPSISLSHTNFIDGVETNGNLQMKSRSLEDSLRSESQNNAFDLLKGTYIKHSTVVVRKECMDLAFVYSSKAIPGLDALIYVSVGMKGNFSFLNDVTTLHRIHHSGLYNSSTRDSREVLKEEFRWYCASNLPPGRLRTLFRRQVLESELRGLIRNCTVYKYIKPLVQLVRYLKNYNRGISLSSIDRA